MTTDYACDPLQINLENEVVEINTKNLKQLSYFGDATRMYPNLQFLLKVYISPIMIPNFYNIPNMMIV